MVKAINRTIRTEIARFVERLFQRVKQEKTNARTVGRGALKSIGEYYVMISLGFDF